MAKKIEQVVPEIIDSVDGLNAKMNAMREAQKAFSTFTQEQVDKIFFCSSKRSRQDASSTCKDGSRRDRHGRG